MSNNKISALLKIHLLFSVWCLEYIQRAFSRRPALKYGAGGIFKISQVYEPVAKLGTYPVAFYDDAKSLLDLK